MLVGRGTGPPRKRSLRREIPTRSLCCYLGQLGHSAVFLSFGGYGARVQLEKERSEEHTSELQSLMRISYAVFCLKKKKYKSSKPHQERQLNKQAYNNTTD